MRGNKLVLAVISGMAVLSFHTSALAFTMSAPEGWYAEINGGSARLTHTNYQPAKSSTSGMGGNANLGYKFMPYVAAEIGYTAYPYNKLTYLGEQIAKISRYSYDFALKGIVPIYDSGVEVFAKLGAVHMQAKLRTSNDIATTVTSSSSATGLYGGVGAQLNIWPELGVVAQWQRAQGNNNTGNEDLYSLGISFIFI